jgi:hypothetical protein
LIGFGGILEGFLPSLVSQPLPRSKKRSTSC